MRHRVQIQCGNALEVLGIAGVERKAVGDGGRGDESVIRACRPLAAGGAKGHRHCAESTGRCRVEGDGVKVVFGLLKMRLP